MSGQLDLELEAKVEERRLHIQSKIDNKVFNPTKDNDIWLKELNRINIEITSLTDKLLL